MSEFAAENIARIALAVDYQENGYRSMIGTGLNDPCLLNSVLAVAAAHHSKWQNLEDINSRLYMRRALTSLRLRLQDTNLAVSDTTIGAILSLMSYEVCPDQEQLPREY